MSPFEVPLPGPCGHIPQANGAALISTDHLQSAATASASILGCSTDGDLTSLAWQWPGLRQSVLLRPPLSISKASSL